jgi:hypothetical protein
MQVHNKECVDVLSDYLVHILSNNTNLYALYAHPTLCMCPFVTRRKFRMNGLLHISQIDGHSTLLVLKNIHPAMLAE